MDVASVLGEEALQAVGFEEGAVEQRAVVVLEEGAVGRFVRKVSPTRIRAVGEVLRPLLFELGLLFVRTHGHRYNATTLSLRVQRVTARTGNPERGGGSLWCVHLLRLCVHLLEGQI